VHRWVLNHFRKKDLEWAQRFDLEGYLMKRDMVRRDVMERDMMGRDMMKRER